MSKIKVARKLIFRHRHNSFRDDMKLLMRLFEIFWVFPLRGKFVPAFLNVLLYFVSFKAHFNIFHSWSLTVTSYVGFFLLATECLILMVYFVYLASKWPLISRQFDYIEKTMKNYEEIDFYPRRIFNAFIIARILYILVYFFFTIIQFHIKGVLFKWSKPTSTFVITDLVIAVSYLQKLFVFSFKEIPIIFVSIYFSARLRQVRKRIQFMSKVRIENIHVWRAIRQDYSNLSRLCQLLNSSLGFLVVMAYLLNMFDLLLQSFVAIIVSYTYEIHFKRMVSCFKLTFMFIRISLLCYYGGSVHNENEKIIDALVSVPSDIYNSEVERFLLHAASETMVLTGMNFFKVRRSLLLPMTNALVTYELVIIQFVQKFNQLE